MKRPVVLAAGPVAAVAVIAGVVSYSHIVALGARTGQSPADAHLLPLAVDGLIVSGSVILLAGSLLGWLGVIPGVAATLFANLESGLPHGALAAVVATWPAVAFTVASFMLERWLKSQVTVPVPVSRAVPAPVSRGVSRVARRRTRGTAPGTDPEVHFAPVLAAGELPSVRRIRAEMHVGQPKAQQIRTQLAAAVSAAPPAEQ